MDTVDMVEIDGLNVGNTTIKALCAEVEDAFDDLEEGEAVRIAIPAAFYLTVRSVESLKETLADLFDGLELDLGTDEAQGTVMYVGWSDETASVETVDVWEE